jgi:hypothetical protein
MCTNQHRRNVQLALEICNRDDALHNILFFVDTCGTCSDSHVIQDEVQLAQTQADVTVGIVILGSKSRS